MTVFFLVLLALAWAAVFMPAVMRAREGTPLRSAERFKRGMDSIAPRLAQVAPSQPVRPQKGPAAGGPRRSRSAAASFRRRQRHRREILTFLVSAVATSGLAALLVGGALWEVHVAFAGSLAAFVLLLRDERKRRLERTTKVRRLRPRAASPNRAALEEPARALR